MGRAWVLIALTMAAAVGAAADAEYIPEKATKCWDCHSDDPIPPTPLGSLYDIIPPQPTPVAPGVPLPWAVEVMDAWYHDLRYIEVGLDLTNAPSLAFFDDREPFADTLTAGITRPTPGVNAPEPPNLQPEVTGVQDPAEGYAVVQIPVGATSMALTMQALDANPPEIRWWIDANADGPGGDPDFGPFFSRSEVVTFTRDSVADFAGYGYGNWTIIGEVLPFDSDGMPQVYGTTVPFEVTVDAKFESTEQRYALQTRSVKVKPFTSQLFTFDLVGAGTPSVEEYIEVVVNATVHWKHKPGDNAEDWGNATKSIIIPVRDQEGTPYIEPSADLLVVTIPEPGTGVNLPAIAEAVGYASAFLIISSIVSGGVFGKASRRGLNRIFGGARRRVAFHNFLSYGLTGAAIAHTAIFLTLNIQGGPYNWTLGLIWGGLAILAMFGLGITGAMQVPLIRRWNYNAWRWTHFGLAMAAILFTIVHILLDGVHFGDLQERIGWSDPLDFRDSTRR